MGGSFRGPTDQERKARILRIQDPLSASSLPTLLGESIKFDGIDDFLLLDQAAVLSNLTSSMTLVVAFAIDEDLQKSSWILSTNDLESPPPVGPKGFGLYLDDFGALRPMVGSENRYISKSKVGRGVHVATLSVSPSTYKMWINSSLEFSKPNGGPRSMNNEISSEEDEILNSARTLVLGTGATAGQMDEFFPGSLKELVVFNEVLSDMDRYQAERLLCIRWQGCEPAPGYIIWKMRNDSVRPYGRYYNVEIHRTQGSDGRVEVHIDLANLQNVVESVDFSIDPEVRIVSWEHGDSSPKYVPILIKEKLTTPMSQKFSLSMAVKCSTFSGVRSTTDKFELVLDPGPTLTWTSAAPLQGNFSGGTLIEFQVIGAGLLNFNYSCIFLQPTGIDTQLYSTCKEIVPAELVSSNIVQCIAPYWKCTGSVLKLGLLRNGEFGDETCTRSIPSAQAPVERVLRSIIPSFQDSQAVDYNFVYECSIPPWVPVHVESLNVNRNFNILEPLLFQVVPNHAPALGGVNITIIGARFDTVDSSPVVAIGDQTCASTEWTSESIVLCKLQPGVNSNLDVRWLVAQPDGNLVVRSTLFASFSYNSPEIFQITPFLLDQSSGNEVVTLQGVNFGDLDRKPALRFEQSQCKAAEWTSDSSITCQPVQGFGGVTQINLNFSRTDINLSWIPGFVIFGFLPCIAVNGLQPLGNASLPLASGGQEELVIYGNNFPSRNQSGAFWFQIGNTAAGITEYESSTSMRIRSPAGAGKDIPVIFVSNGLWSSTNLTVSFKAPIITAISPSNSPALAVDHWITIFGSNFGPTEEIPGPYGMGAINDPHLRNETCPILLIDTIPTDNLGQSVSIGSSSCSSIHHVSSTSLKCKLANGTGSNLRVTLSLNGYQVDYQSFHYDSPELTTISPANVPPSNDVISVLTVYGKNFGVEECSGACSLNISIETRCGETTWISDSSLLCKGPFVASTNSTFIQGVGSHRVQGAAMSADGAVDFLSNVSFHFDAPVITSLAPREVPSTGIHFVSFLGSNFGLEDFSPVARIGSCACTTTEYVSDSSLKCQVPAYASFLTEMNNASVEVGGTISESTLRLRYLSRPVIEFLRPSNSPNTGKKDITILGLNLGITVDTVVAKIAQAACLQTTWLSTTSLVCTAPPGRGKAQPVEVFIQSNLATISLERAGAFSYDYPYLSVTSLGNAAPRGGQTVRILGGNFGVDGQRGAIVGMVDSTRCLETRWTSDSSIDCTLSPGIGNSVIWLKSSCDDFNGGTKFSCIETPQDARVPLVWDRPVFSESTYSVRTTEQEYNFTGNNFGSFDSSIYLKIGETNTSFCNWFSDTSISCTIRGGLGLNNAEIFYLAHDVNTPLQNYSNLFSFDNPVIYNVFPDFGPNTGGQIVTLNGTNFSPFDNSVVIKIGSSLCRSSAWISDSSLFCSTPAGAYIHRTVAIDFNDGVARASKERAFNYSSKTCGEIKKYEPGARDGDYMLNSKPSVWDAFVVFCSMIYEVVGLDSLGSIRTAPTVWLDASYEAYFRFRPNVSDLNVIEWKSRVGDALFEPNQAGCLEPQLVRSDQTWTKRAGNVDGTLQGFNLVNPGMVAFEGINSSLSSPIEPADYQSSLTIFLAFSRLGSGFLLSNNQKSPLSGFGVYVEKEGNVRSILSSEVRYVSAAQLLDNKLYIVSLVADASQSKLWVDSELSLGYQKFLCAETVSGIFVKDAQCVSKENFYACLKPEYQQPEQSLFADSTLHYDVTSSLDLKEDLNALGSLQFTWKSTVGTHQIVGVVAQDKFTIKDAIPALSLNCSFFNEPLDNSRSALTMLAVFRTNRIVNDDFPKILSRILFGGNVSQTDSTCRINGENCSASNASGTVVLSSTIQGQVSSDCTGDCACLVATACEDCEIELAEVLVWDTILGEQNIQQLEDFLMAKYLVRSPCEESGVNLAEGTASLNLGTYPDHIINAGSDSGFFKGDIAEVLIFNNSLSDADRMDVERSMCLRWKQNCAYVTFEMSISGLYQDFLGLKMSLQQLITDGLSQQFTFDHVIVTASQTSSAQTSGRRLLQTTTDQYYVNIKIIGLSDLQASSMQTSLSSTLFSSISQSIADTLSFDVQLLSISSGGYVNAGKASFTPSEIQTYESYIHNNTYQPEIIRIKVNRVEGTDGTVIVDYFTVNGSAVAGLDYIPVAGSLVWGHGNNQEKTIEVSVVDNELFQPGPRNFSIQFRVTYSQFGPFGFSGSSQVPVEVRDNPLSPSPFWEDVVSEAGSGSYLGPVGGSFSIVVRGHNFPNRSDYHCVVYTSCSSASTSISWLDLQTGTRMCGLESTEPAEFVNDTSVRCVVPPWTPPYSDEEEVMLRFGVGESIGEGIDRVAGTFRFKFKFPHVVGSVPNHSPTFPAATDAITVIGNNFGYSETDVSFFIGESAVLNALWLSDSSVKATGLPSGSGRMIDLRMVIWNQNATASALFSYDAPSVSNTVRDLGDCSALTITIQGVNFGTQMTIPRDVKIDNSTCSQLSWTSDSQVECITDVQARATRPDAGRKTNIAMTVDGVTGITEDIFELRNLPNISAISPPNGPVLDNLRNLTILGSSFGRQDNFSYISTQDNVCKDQVWVSLSSISCLCEFTGFNPINLHIADPLYGDFSSTVEFNFDLPQITAIPYTVPSDRSSNLTVLGLNLGNYQQPPACYFRGSPTDTFWQSDSSLMCTVPAEDKGLPIVSLNNLEDVHFSYGPACVTQISPSAVPTLGGDVVLTGKNFGVMDFDVKVFTGEQLCSNVRWTSDSSLACTVEPEATNWKLPVAVVKKNETSVCNETSVVYSDLNLTSILPSKGPGERGGNITIFGHNFGISSPDGVTAAFTDSPCEHTSWISDSSVFCEGAPTISCETVQGYTCNLPLKVNLTLSAASRSTSGFYEYSVGSPSFVGVTTDENTNVLHEAYDLPADVLLLKANGKTTIAFELEHWCLCNVTPKVLESSYCSPYDVSSRQTTCSIQPLKEDIQEGCLSPINISLTENNNSVTDRLIESFYVKLPSVVNMIPSNLPRQLDVNITITGSCFGPKDLSPKVSVGALQFATTWVSSSSV
eukprot:751627-Hanusia_phi.AAC.1